MDLTGIQLGKYHVVEQLDTGGMAEVYKAYQPDLDRYVAVKVITSDLSSDPMFLEQFEREARMLARLEHPNILPIYDSGRYGDTPYLVTQYVQEGTLADRGGKPLPPEEAVRIVCQVGDALSYAHAMGVVHRDVKPSNVLFAKSGNVLLADFGIAQVVQSQHETDTDSDIVSGTPAYMAPEQRAGKSVDGRADIYALGVLLYELLTGKRANEQMLLARSFGAIRIPAPLREVVAQAIETRPDDRYEVAEDFVAAAQEALFKIKEEYVEPSTLTQQALEAVAIAIFILLGLGLGLLTIRLIITSRSSDHWLGITMGPALWVGALTGSFSFLLNAALLIFRDRNRPISLALVGAIASIFTSSACMIFPLIVALEILPELPLSLGSTSGGALVNYVGFEVMCCLPAMLPLISAAGLYAYHHRQPRAIVQQGAQRARQFEKTSRPFAARRGRFVTRKTRNEIIKALIGAIAVAMLARLLAHVAPPRSPVAYLAPVLQYGVIYVGVLLGIALIVWYTYSQITIPSEASTDQMPSQVLSQVEIRLDRLDRARAYQAHIEEAITQAREGPVRERLQSATRRLADWIVYIERLTARLNELDRDPIIRRDRSTVPRAINRLESRLILDQDTDTGVSNAVHRTLAARQLQLQYLRALERVMTRAELYSEETIAALGTIYSQVLLVDARDVEGVRAKRLQADIEEQVQALSDLLDAIEEVQGYRQDEHNYNYMARAIE
jgi:serine/threonine protein kinase